VRQSAAKPTLTLPLVHEYLNLAWSPDGLTVAMGSANLDSSDDAAKVHANELLRKLTKAWCSRASLALSSDCARVYTDDSMISPGKLSWPFLVLPLAFSLRFWCFETFLTSCPYSFHIPGLHVASGHAAQHCAHYEVSVPSGRVQLQPKLPVLAHDHRKRYCGSGPSSRQLLFLLVVVVVVVFCFFLGPKHW